MSHTIRYTRAQVIGYSCYINILMTVVTTDSLSDLVHSTELSGPSLPVSIFNITATNIKNENS